MASKKRRVRQYQRSSGKRARKHGYRSKKLTPGGRNVLKRRILKGRKKLTPQRKMGRK